MKGKNPAFVELLLILVFFSIASVILVQIFSAAFLMSKESVALGNVQMYMQGQMDLWQIDPQQMELEPGTYHFDEQMNETAQGSYVITVKESEEELVRSLRLVFASKDKVLIDLDATVLKESGV